MQVVQLTCSADFGIQQRTDFFESLVTSLNLEVLETEVLALHEGLVVRCRKD